MEEAHVLPDDRQHRGYTGEDGHAYYVSYDGETWSDWQDLSENYAYDPLQYEYAWEHYLAYTGEDGSVYSKTYDAAAEEGY